MKPTQQIERIKGLMDRYLEVVHSDKNKENQKLWKNSYDWNRDKLRGIAPTREGNPLPYVVELDISLWRKFCGDVSLLKFYSDPYVHMELQLQQKLKHHEMFDDNFVYTDELSLWFGVVTELSFFGSEIVFQELKEAWIKEPILHEYEDLAKLTPPDFRKSGLMPKILECYEVMSEVADGKLKVMFPELARGPFCIAVHLRGMEDFLCDTIAEPEWVHRLMRFIVDAHKSWSKERAKFVGKEQDKCKLFNDEICSPIIGPATYDNFVFPYEKELAEHYGGVRYFHSCGLLDPFLPRIAELPGLDACHVGPWTSYEEADKVFGDRTALEICLHPMEDVMMAKEDQMRGKIEDIMEKCKHRNYSLRADTFMPSGDLNQQMEKIHLWESVAKKTFKVRG